MPDLSLLVALVFGAACFAVWQKLRAPCALRCRPCDAEMDFDGIAPDTSAAVLGLSHLPSAPDQPAEWAFFHCPQCGRRVRVRG